MKLLGATLSHLQVAELNVKLSDMETGINRQQYEASEVKVSWELQSPLSLSLFLSPPFSPPSSMHVACM